MVRPDLELLGHVGDDIGLADGLAAGDRQRVIRIGFVGVVGRHEILARHFIERTQDSGVGNAALAHLELELHASHAFVARRAGHAGLGSPLRLRVRISQAIIRNNCEVSNWMRAPAAYDRTSASLVRNGSSVISRRSGVTEM